jgi:beta-lactamase class A
VLLAAATVAVAVSATTGVALRDARAETHAAASTPRSQGATTTPAPAATSVPTPAATSVPTPAAVRNPQALLGSLEAAIAASGAAVSVDVVDLRRQQAVSIQPAVSWTAASTYKLPLLMDETDLIARGKAAAGDSLCYTDADYEDGYYGDYSDGECFTRLELMTRVGHDSDNTAAHILVRYLGGAAALNAFAKANGAVASGFYDPNTTTAADLAALLVREATAPAAARAELQALLTHTAYEAGIPAGVPGTATVVHKVGMLDAVTNDAALVFGPQPYVLVVMTDGLGGDAAWALIARLSAIVWQWEAAA